MKIADLKIDTQAIINGHEYRYKGQQMRKANGYRATFVVFESTKGMGEKLFNVSAPLEVVKTGDTYEVRVVRRT